MNCQIIFCPILSTEVLVKLSGKFQGSQFSQFRKQRPVVVFVIMKLNQDPSKAIRKIYMKSDYDLSNTIFCKTSENYHPLDPRTYKYSGLRYLNALWQEIFVGVYFCGLAILCLLRLGQIGFSRWELVFAIFKKVTSTHH